jgi:hypothetical protein
LLFGNKVKKRKNDFVRVSLFPSQCLGKSITAVAYCKQAAESIPNPTAGSDVLSLRFPLQSHQQPNGFGLAEAEVREDFHE